MAVVSRYDDSLSGVCASRINKNFVELLTNNKYKRQMNNIRTLVILSELLESSENDSELDFFEKDDFESLFSSSSSSSEESKMELNGQGHVDLDSFMRKIDAYMDQDFTRNFRLKRSTVDFLISIYGKTEEVMLPDSKKPILDFRKDIFMYLWYITHFMNYKELGTLFGVTKASSEAAVRRVCHWLISIGHEYIKWPQGEEVAENSKKFEQRARIPGVVGAIDCTHITVKAPRVNKDWYYNRQHNYSIVLQAVVDADKKFIDVCCGEPGSQRDLAILRKSELHQKARSDFTDLFPGESFIVGDLAYAPSTWLVPPYRDSENLLDAQRTFNNIHATTRKVVEHALELLKGRFQRLAMFTEETNFCTVTNLVVSACILHNICILKDDLYGNGASVKYEVESSEEGECTIENSSTDATVNRRKILFNHLQKVGII